MLYPGTAWFDKANFNLSSLPCSCFRSISIASSLVKTSVKYRKSMHPTNSSGVMSTTSRQSGLYCDFAQRSQTALRMAHAASCMTPRSGDMNRI